MNRRLKWGWRQPEGRLWATLEILHQGIQHFEALCKAHAKQACDEKKKKDVKGKSNASNNAAATADSQEDEPFEED